MAAVYRAIDPDLGRPVAIQVLLAGGMASPAELARFLREVRLTGQLVHPGIPPVHELGETGDGNLYFAMKMIEGTSLAEAIREGTRDRRRLLADFTRVCEAVAYTHSRGVIHRDLKPANIMVGEFGEVLVMDWGLAKVEAAGPTPGVKGSRRNPRRRARAPSADGAGPRSADLTATGDDTGTPAYMSPEQADGNLAKIDARTDVYSLGAVLYQILTGGPPYPGKSLPQIMTAMTKGGPEPPSARAPGAGVGRELDAIALRAMAFECGQRHASARELGADVEAYLAGYPVSVLRYNALQRLAKWARRNPSVSAVAAAALVAITFFVGWLVVERGRALASEALARAAAERNLAAAYHARALGALLRGQRARSALLAAESLARDPDGAALPAFYASLHAAAHPLGRIVAHHASRIVGVSFSPDGRRVVTASEDRTARIWDVSDLYLAGPEHVWRARLATGAVLAGEDVLPEPLLLFAQALAARLADSLPAASQELASALGSGTPREADMARAVEFVFEAADPALAWLALYRGLEGAPAANTRRLLLLEAIEARLAAGRDASRPLLDLATTLLRRSLDALTPETKDEARAAIGTALGAARQAAAGHPLTRGAGEWLESLVRR